MLIFRGHFLVMFKAFKYTKKKVSSEYLASHTSEDSHNSTHPLTRLIPGSSLEKRYLICQTRILIIPGVQFGRFTFKI